MLSNELLLLDAEKVSQMQSWLTTQYVVNCTIVLHAVLGADTLGMHEKCTRIEPINTRHNPLHARVGKDDGHNPFGSDGFAKQTDEKILEQCCSENCFSYFKTNNLTCDGGEARGAVGTGPNRVKVDRRGSKTHGEIL